MTPQFNRLFRFENEHGEQLYGELPPSHSIESVIRTEVEVYDGNVPWDPAFKRSSRWQLVAKILAPLPHVPMFIGVGLNYKQHVIEGKFPIPEAPFLFMKPPASLAGPGEDIKVPTEAKMLDYEGELCVIIGKTCKDPPPDCDITDYILGYTVGNDLSSRFWQQAERSGQQANYSKGFDQFAPIGPVVSSTKQISDPGQLTITTTVNDEERQRSSTNDLIFNVDALVRFCSAGHTLEPGTVLMTGTPSGVGAFMKPPVWLQHGDVVEIEIDGIGKLWNRLVFAE